jgi:hypothetical protein
MNQFIEFEYETVKGKLLIVQGNAIGQKVEFIVHNEDHFIVPRHRLTTLDIRNIEDYILENSEPELDFYDLDYRGER